MTVIKWRESYATGIQQFDDEHRGLVELVNKMFITMRDKVPKAEVDPILNELLRYTETHFDNEEQVLKATNYPEFQEHKDEHDKLREETLQFNKILEEDFENGAKNFYKFLREWLMEHILEYDHKYSEHLKEYKL